MLKEFTYIIRVVLVLFAIITLIYLLISKRVVIETNELQRFSIELAENILNSHIVEGRAVFDADELSQYTYSTQEPYFRNCKYAYHLEIETIEGRSCVKHDDCRDFCIEICGLNNIIFGKNCECANVCRCKKDGIWIEKEKWSFGYPGGPPKKDIESYSTTYDVGVNINGELKPAKMHLTVYDDWLTEISCLIEKAWERKSVQKMKIPCIPPFFVPTIEENKNCMGLFSKMAGEMGLCMFPLIKDGDNLCLVDLCLQNGKYQYYVKRACRYLDIPVLPFFHPYKKGERILKAVPVSENLKILWEGDINAMKENIVKVCNTIKPVSNINENTKYIVLCLGDV